MKNARFLALLLAMVLMASCALAEGAEDPVALKAGDVSVPLSKVQGYFEELYAQYGEYYASYGLTLTEEDIGYIRDEAMETMALYAILDNKVVEYGLGEITDEDRASLREQAAVEFEESLASYAAYYGLSVEEAREDLVGYGITEETQYEMMLESLPYNRLYEKIVGEAVVTDEAIDAEYAAYVETDKASYENDVASYEMYTNYYGSEIYYTPAGFRLVKHILLETPAEIAAELIDLETDMSAVQSEIETLTQELYALENVGEEGEEETEAPARTAEEIQAEIDEKQAAFEALSASYDGMNEQVLPSLQDTIDEIYARFQDGESFDVLIETYGADPGMSANPAGYKVHKDSILWDADFRDGAMALANIGDLSDPILTGFGVHIIQYTGDVEGGAVPITDAVRETIRETLLSTAQEEAFNAAVAKWMEEMPVEKYPELIVLPAPTVEGDGEEAPETEEEAVG